MTAGQVPDADPNRVTDDATRSDALVVFGATGDLAHKMIFPALYVLVRQGVLDLPVIGIAHSNANLAQLLARAEDGIRQSMASVDPRILKRLLSMLQYVDGDYNDASTFQALKKMIGTARHPAHYLAIPPSLSRPFSRDSAPPAWPRGPRNRRKALRP